MAGPETIVGYHYSDIYRSVITTAIESVGSREAAVFDHPLPASRVLAVRGKGLVVPAERVRIAAGNVTKSKNESLGLMRLAEARRLPWALIAHPATVVPYEMIKAAPDNSTVITTNESAEANVRDMWRQIMTPDEATQQLVADALRSWLFRLPAPPVQ